MSGKDFSYALTIKASLERANSIVSSSQIKYEGAESKMNVSKMKNSSIMLFEQNPKDELLKLIKEKGKISKRIWKNQVIKKLMNNYIYF